MTIASDKTNTTAQHNDHSAHHNALGVAANAAAANIVTLLAAVPTGGSTRQALVKINSTDRHTQWATLREVPAGGTAGYVLASTGGGGYEWSNVVGPAGARGPKGDKGDQGEPGTNGTNGAPGGPVPNAAGNDGKWLTVNTVSHQPSWEDITPLKPDTDQIGKVWGMVADEGLGAAGAWVNSGGSVEAVGTLGTSGTVTLTPATTAVYHCVPAGDITIAISAYTGGAATLTVHFVLGATPHTVTWPAGIKWTIGSEPVLPVSHHTVITLFSTDDGTTWIGTIAMQAAA